MKNLLFLLILLLPLSLQAQYLINGAQCDTHGAATCAHYESPCPPGTTADIRLVLETDDMAAETNWQLTDETDNGSIVGESSGLDNNTLYVHSFCAFIDHCYKFTIEDSGGNGITSENGYQVYWNGDLIQSGGDFGSVETVDWGGCCTDFTVELKGGIACTYNHYGLIFTEIENGTPPFQYEWSSGASHVEVHPIDISDTNIAVTITDAAGCVGSAVLDLNDLAPLAVDMETTPVTSAEPNSATAAAIVNSGIPPFLYIWSNEEMTQHIEGLTEGEYIVTVTDASGCVATAMDTIVNFLKEQAIPIFGLQCYPNPTDKLIQVSFTALTSSKGVLQIVNAIGIVVLRQDIDILTGENTHSLNLSNLPSGQYWVGIQIEELRQFRSVQLVK